MTPERFAALAAAYGGTIDRWPEAERAAARAFRDAHPEAEAVLAAEAALDAALARWAVPAPGAALVGRIARDAARRRQSPRRLRLWLAGLGLAGALAGGGAIGAVLVARLVPAGGAGCSQSLTVLGAPVPSCGDAANWSDTL